METYKCPRCNGSMRIYDYENDNLYSDDSKMPCPTCEGEGVLEKGELENGNL